MIRLEEGEKILYTVRKHWFVFLADILSVGILILLACGLIGLLYYISTVHVLPGSIVALILFGSSLILLLLWLAAFIIWTDYYLDILILTNKHIIDVEQKGLFSRELSTFRLDKIQDVTTEVNGIIPTFLKFGTIHIQTAGEDRDFLIKGVPKPFDVRHIISTQQGELEEEGRIVHLSDESLEKIKHSS